MSRTEVEFSEIEAEAKEKIKYEINLFINFYIKDGLDIFSLTEKILDRFNDYINAFSSMEKFEKINFMHGISDYSYSEDDDIVLEMIEDHVHSLRVVYQAREMIKKGFIETHISIKYPSLKIKKVG